MLHKKVFALSLASAFVLLGNGCIEFRSVEDEPVVVVEKETDADPDTVVVTEEPKENTGESLAYDCGDAAEDFSSYPWYSSAEALYKSSLEDARVLAIKQGCFFGSDNIFVFTAQKSDDGCSPFFRLDTSTGSGKHVKDICVSKFEIVNGAKAIAYEGERYNEQNNGADMKYTGMYYYAEDRIAKNTNVLE